MQTSWHSQQKPVCWEKTLVFGIQYFTSIRLIINSLINAKPYTVSGCIKNDLTGARFGSTYTKIGTIQRRLAWPLRKDDMQIREAFHVKKKKKRSDWSLGFSLGCCSRLWFSSLWNETFGVFTFKYFPIEPYHLSSLWRSKTRNRGISYKDGRADNGQHLEVIFLV